MDIKYDNLTYEEKQTLFNLLKKDGFYEDLSKSTIIYQILSDYGEKEKIKDGLNNDCEWGVIVIRHIKNDILEILDYLTGNYELTKTNNVIRRKTVENQKTDIYRRLATDIIKPMIPYLDDAYKTYRKVQDDAWQKRKESKMEELL